MVARVDDSIPTEMSGDSSRGYGKLGSRFSGEGDGGRLLGPGLCGWLRSPVWWTCHRGYQDRG